MISTPLKSMMPDRPEKTQTIDIMSGPNYRTDRTHPFRGVLMSGGWMMSDRYIGLYLPLLRMHSTSAISDQTYFVSCISQVCP